MLFGGWREGFRCTVAMTIEEVMLGKLQHLLPIPTGTEMERGGGGENNSGGKKNR